MSTEKIREALGALLAESARANDFAGGPREPGAAERALYRAALVEVEAVERERRLAREQIESMRAECCRRAVLDPEDVAEGLERLLRILGDAPEGRS